MIFGGWVLYCVNFNTFIEQDSVLHVSIAVQKFGALSQENGEYRPADGPFDAYKGEKTALLKY
jgi:hypothetical protein